MNFTIPVEVNNDILYCQKSLRHYIHVHQMLANSLHSKNMLDDPRLAELENEILDIGREQKRTVDTLRLLMENFFVLLEKQNLSIDRSVANTNVANQLLLNFQKCFDKVEPINVKKRLSDSELIDRYIYNTLAPTSSARVIKFTECNKPEKLEVLISPNDVVFQNVSSPPPQKPQISLLKPKSERLVPNSPRNTSDEQSPSSSSANLNSRRLNLLQVLNKTKAKNRNIEPEEKHDKQIENTVAGPEVTNASDSQLKEVVLTESAPIETVIVSYSPPSSSTSLSGDTFCGPDLPDEEEEPTVLGKEPFLRVFGLYTHTYHEYLKMRRSERKRRNCTSTEKRDFHYGKIDILFDRQSTKAKRVFLKSTREPRPNITKPKRKQSDANLPSKKLKTESKSNSSSSSSICDEMKMCITCMKTTSEKNLECEACNVYYHVSCHDSGEMPATHSLRIKNRFCPDCLRRQQKAREKSAIQQRDKKYKKLFLKQKKLTEHREQLLGELKDLEFKITDKFEEYHHLDSQRLFKEKTLKLLLEPINKLTGGSVQLNDLQLNDL